MTTIDLTAIDPPDLVDTLDFEDIYQEKVQHFKDIYPDWNAALESDPVPKLIELSAYGEVRLRARINDAAKAVMLAFATGADLEHLAALLEVERATIDLGDLTADPPVDPTLEGDPRLKLRTQMSIEKATVAGPFGAYVALALDASADVLDVFVDRPVPGTVRLTVLSASGTGVPVQSTLDAVEATLSDDTVRPLNDTVIATAAAPVDYAIEADVYIGGGPDPAPVLSARRDALDTAVAAGRKLGAGMPKSAISGALHPPGSGVTKVELIQPVDDVDCNGRQFANCTSIVLNLREG